MVLQQMSGPSQVLPTLGYMSRNERSLWMTRNHPVALIEQLFF